MIDKTSGEQTVAHSIIRRIDEGFVVKLSDEVSDAFPSVVDLLGAISPHVDLALAERLLASSSALQRLRSLTGGVTAIKTADGADEEDDSFESEEEGDGGDNTPND